jgi:protein ImuB
VLKLRIELNPIKPRTQQHGLFVARSPEPAKLEITLSRLCNLLGPDNVGTPELLDTHRPDSFRMTRFTAAIYKTDVSPCPFEVLTLRRYRPPQIAQVRFLEEAPTHIATMALKSIFIACAGPWRSSGDWWQHDPWDHSEWDIAVTSGALYRIHEDLRRGRWFLEGNYD